MASWDEGKAMTSDNIKLKSGYELYANCGFVGINEELNVAEGYDGSLPEPSYGEFYDKDYPGPSKADMLELCDILIDRWTRLRAKIEAIPCP